MGATSGKHKASKEKDLDDEEFISSDDDDDVGIDSEASYEDDSIEASSDETSGSDGESNDTSRPPDTESEDDIEGLGPTTLRRKNGRFSKSNSLKDRLRKQPRHSYGPPEYDEDIFEATTADHPNEQQAKKRSASQRPDTRAYTAQTAKRPRLGRSDFGPTMRANAGAREAATYPSDDDEEKPEHLRQANIEPETQPVTSARPQILDIPCPPGYEDLWNMLKKHQTATNKARLETQALLVVRRRVLKRLGEVKAQHRSKLRNMCEARDDRKMLQELLWYLHERMKPEEITVLLARD